MSDDGRKPPDSTLPGNILQNAQQLREQLGVAAGPHGAQASSAPPYHNAQAPHPGQPQPPYPNANAQSPSPYQQPQPPYPNAQPHPAQPSPYHNAQAPHPGQPQLYSNANAQSPSPYQQPQPPHPNAQPHPAQASPYQQPPGQPQLYSNANAQSPSPYQQPQPPYPNAQPHPAQPSPYHNAQAPHPGQPQPPYSNAQPHPAQPSPYHNAQAPHTGQPQPYSNANAQSRSPHQQPQPSYPNAQPHPAQPSPDHNAQAPHPGPSPQHAQSPYHNAQAPHPGQPYPSAQPYPAQLPNAQVLTPRRTHLAQAVKPPTGTGFVAMAILSLKRAFRLRIDANEVLDDERAAMLAARPAITDESQQAFLAWRRSILFVAALLMIPVAIVHIADDLKSEDGTPEIWKQLSYVQAIVEICFAVFLWTQVGRWRAWRTQSRRLALGWLLYFLTPFLVFLYPLASAFDYGAMDPATAHATKIAVGMAIGAQAFLSLAPKIISLLQGLIRASIATKTLFPGSSAPGWLMVIAAPLYMIIFYTFVLLPYHFTGETLVVLGTLLVLAAKSTLVRAGLKLTRPMTDEDAQHSTHRAQMIWMSLLLGGIGFIVGGLWNLVSQASPLSVLNFALSMGANILLLTLIATDTIISALDRARGVTPEETALAASVQDDIAAFTALRD